MKKILSTVMLLTFCFALTACGKAADRLGDNAPDSGINVVEPPAGPDQEAGTGDSSIVPENDIKTTFKDENLNEVILYRNNDESYGMVVTIYRLTEIEGDAAIDGDGFILNGTDAAGQPVTLGFYPGSDGYTLEVMESTWSFLPAGEAFAGFKPVLK